jgi:hypothetical protein
MEEGASKHTCGIRANSLHILIAADQLNHRVQVLRLVVGADGISAHLEFVRFLGSGRGSAGGGPAQQPLRQLGYPFGAALLQARTDSSLVRAFLAFGPVFFPAPPPTKRLPGVSLLGACV